MQQGMSSQVDGLANQVRQQINLGFQNMQQQFQNQLNTDFQAFG